MKYKLRLPQHWIFVLKFAYFVRNNYPNQVHVILNKLKTFLMILVYLTLAETESYARSFKKILSFDKEKKQFAMKKKTVCDDDKRDIMIFRNHL